MPTPIEWIPFDQLAKVRVRRGSHAMTKKILNWPYCAHCGLVALKNEASRRKLKEPCVTVEDG